MHTFTTKPKDILSSTEFKKIIRNKEIILSPHTLARLSEKQRKIFKEDDLKNTLKRQNPRKVFLQENGRYAVYFRQKQGFRKLVLDITENAVIIITFMNTINIQRYEL